MYIPRIPSEGVVLDIRYASKGIIMSCLVCYIITRRYQAVLYDSKERHILIIVVSYFPATQASMPRAFSESPAAVVMMVVVVVLVVSEW